VIRFRTFPSSATTVKVGVRPYVPESAPVTRVTVVETGPEGERLRVLDPNWQLSPGARFSQCKWTVDAYPSAEVNVSVIGPTDCPGYIVEVAGGAIAAVKPTTYVAEA